MKFTLLPSGAIATNYDTKEFKLNKRVSSSVSVANNGISLLKGTNLLSIDNDVNISESELKEFADNNFENSDVAFKRINSIIHPTAHATIF
jgi:hypothetical protein